MFEVSDIVDELLSINPIFSKGFEADKYYQGLDDSNSRHFFIQLVSNDDGDAFDVVDGDDDDMIICTYKLLALIDFCDEKDALFRLAGQLTKMGALVTSMGCDARKIYMDEYGEELKSDLGILRIKFQLKDIAKFCMSNCKGLCEADCKPVL